MGDLHTRPFSKNYSGLINQSVIAIGITVICVSGQELMKRRRRGKALVERSPGLGSRESWEFGYLYQGRSWARFPSPPSPAGWPLSWVTHVLKFPEDKLLELRGLDATIYIRFLRGCFWFTLTQFLTTFPILFPIHVEFSDPSIPSKSMTRTSIASLVTTEKGLSLLWIHICLLFWVTLSWMGTLHWICSGAFKLRAVKLEAAANLAASAAESHEEEDQSYFPHPHPRYPFTAVLSRERDSPAKGIRLRTVMVSNIPPQLRNEKELREYFEYYMSRKVEKPALGLTWATQPGFLNKTLAFLFNRAKRIPAHLPSNPLLHRRERDSDSDQGREQQKEETKTDSKRSFSSPVIERVVVARRMTELASLLERREETLVLLETAHIKLANKALISVKGAIERRTANKPISLGTSKSTEVAKKRRSIALDAELGEPQEEGALDEEERIEQLIEVLGPFVEEFNLHRPLSTHSKKHALRKLHVQFSEDLDNSDVGYNNYPPSSTKNPAKATEKETIWEALLSLPRTSLDAYQPLVNLSHLFTGKVVPSIDYYSAKLNLLTSLITENRSKPLSEFDPVSTAFVTFANHEDARRACKYLTVHPNNPLACFVTMAPAYQDIDWIRVMKSSSKGEFVKDWVVDIGVWGFTLFWLFPVSLLVGLVSIQNISLFWPSLKRYLDRHEWQSEVIQSFIPTLLVALLSLLIPMILLLIAKKFHTIPTLSALHDRIMTRYYKFLIVNVVVFFCVGTAALQSFLQSFRTNSSSANVLEIVASSFPTAGPFYVGWLIFTTAMHGGFELVLLGLPLILYPGTSRQIAPRKRAVGTRPRTFNFYYWLPNHSLVIHVLFLFSVLNPIVLPFGTVYFFIQSGVVKNQLIHVYAKNYEEEGRVLLIRIVRYSLDGLILSQAIFLAYMVVLKKSANVGLAAFLIVFTVFVKLIITRMCRSQYDRDDKIEAEIVCDGGRRRPFNCSENAEAEGLINSTTDEDANNIGKHSRGRTSIITWRLPAWVNFSYSDGIRHLGHRPQHRRPNPFGPNKENDLTQKPTLRHLEPHFSQSESIQQGTSVKANTGPDGLPSSSSHTKGKARIPENVIINTVVPHSPLIPWDDQAQLDLPYDNPFYSRAIESVLWLPRNPTSILDLDDTVDLNVSIPVEVSAGRLGSWLGLNESSSPEELSIGSGNEAENVPVSPRLNSSAFHQVDGSEDIDLPLVIAKRVQAKEKDVDHAVAPRKSSIFQRQPNAEKINVEHISLSSPRRSSILDRPILSSITSYTSARPRSVSFMSSLQSPLSALEQACISDHELGIRPDIHSQADFVIANSSILSLTPPKLSRAQNVSAAEAIFHEVVAEERQGLRDRLEEETAEASKSQSTKSWLTSWMFRKE